MYTRSVLLEDEQHGAGGGGYRVERKKVSGTAFVADCPSDVGIIAAIIVAHEQNDAESRVAMSRIGDGTGYVSLIDPVQLQLLPDEAVQAMGA